MKKIAAVLACAYALASCAAQPTQEPVAPTAAAPMLTAPFARQRAEWNAPFAPFNVIGNIHFVGSAGLSSFLITSPQGHVLIDGALPETADQILQNIRTLGFDPRDVRVLLNSHAHFDHSGGLAALKSATGARFYASEGDREELESGHIAYGPSALVDTPPIHVDHVLADGETITVGNITLTAFVTPGHTQGCTSFSMPVTGADGARHTAFFHCSSSVGGQSVAPEAYPGIVADYRATFARVRGMRADVFLANHPDFFDMAAKRQRQVAGDANAFVDASALQTFNSRMEAAFEAELAQQQARAPTN